MTSTVFEQLVVTLVDADYASDRVCVHKTPPAFGCLGKSCSIKKRLPIGGSWRLLMWLTWKVVYSRTASLARYQQTEFNQKALRIKPHCPSS